MRYLLETLGTSAIGIYFIYMILSFNIKMSDTLTESVTKNITKWNAIEMNKLFDYDFNKIGYRIDKDDLFSVANENEVFFKTDINNDGSADSVCYKLGSTKNARNTSNPYDKPLYRIVNNSDTTIHLVNSFTFSYLDSTGRTITPVSSLNTASERKKIKGLIVVCKLQSPDEINDEYKEIEWKKKYFPKNIN